MLGGLASHDLQQALQRGGVEIFCQMDLKIVGQMNLDAAE